MNCPKCGTENAKEAKFCKGCGASMATELTETNVEENTVQNDAVTTVETTPTVENIVPAQPIQSNTVSAGPTNQANLEKKKFDIKSLDKKKIIVAVAIIIIIIIAIIIGKTLFSSKATTISDLFNPNTPILVEKDGKYGYINSKGKFVIDAKYEKASSFYGNYAVVSDTITEQGVEVPIYQVIDTKGKVKATSHSSSNIDYIAEYNIWIINHQLYDGNLKLKSKEGVEVGYGDYGFLVWENEAKQTAGIMTTDGKITYTYKFASGEDYLSVEPSDTDASLKEKYCRINVENEKYAIVNCNTGKVIYDFTDKYITEDDDNIFEVLDHDTFTKLETLYIQNDKIAYRSSDDVRLNYESGYVSIRDNSYNMTYLDTTTGEITSKRPTTEQVSLSEWEETTGLKKFNCDKGYGLMDGDKVVLSCEWSSVDFFSTLLYQYLKQEGKNYILASKDGKIHLVNLKNGKTIIEFNSNYVSDYELSTFLTYVDKDTNQKIVYNLLTGKSISLDSSNKVSVYTNYMIAKDGSKVTYYNTDLKSIYTTEE